MLRSISVNIETNTRYIMINQKYSISKVMAPEATYEVGDEIYYDYVSTKNGENFYDRSYFKCLVAGPFDKATWKPIKSPSLVKVMPDFTKGRECVCCRAFSPNHMVECRLAAIIGADK